MTDLSEILGVLPNGGEGLLGFFERLKWSGDDLRAFMATMRKTGDFEKLFESRDVAGLLEAGDFFSSSSSEVRFSELTKRARKFVRFRVSEVGKQYIRSVLCDFYDVQFGSTRGVYHPHPVLRVFKEIADDGVWERIPSHKVVLEIGPNPASAIRRGVVRGKYYGLVPRISAADLERQSSAVGHVRGSVKSNSYNPVQKAAADDFLRGTYSDMFIRRKLQEVTVAADVLVALDAVYDVPLGDFVAAMCRCGATDGYVSLVTMPHPALQVVSGKIGKTEMGFDCRDGQYDFFFGGSSTRAYSHSKVVVDEYFQHAIREVVVGEVRYICSRMSTSNEVVTMWHIYRAPTGLIGESSRPTYVRLGGPGSVLIETSAVDLRKSRGSTGRFSDVTYEMGEETFSRALGSRLMDPSGDSVRVLNHLKSNRSNVVYAGVLRSVDGPVPYDSLTGLAVAIDAFARQLESTADSEVLAMRATLSKGGWFQSPGFFSDTLGAFQAKVAATATAMADFPLVTVGIVKTVFVVPNEPLIVGGSESNVFCRKAAVAADVAAKFGADALDTDVLRSWYEAAVRLCGCVSCKLRVDEEETDKFYDCTSDVSEESEVTEDLFSGLDGDGEDSTGSEGSSVPLGAVDSEARSVLADYAHVVDEQMSSAKYKATEAAHHMLNAGGYSKKMLGMYSNESIQHYGVTVGSTGEILGIIGTEAPDEVGLVYDPRRQVFMRPKRIGSHLCVEPEAYGECYSSSALEVWNGPERLAAVQSVLCDPEFGSKFIPPFKFLNGIWGAGKTFLGKKWYNEVRQQGGRVLLLCPSRKPMEAVRSELYGDSSEGKAWVRTVDSALCARGGSVSVTHMLIDEAAMLHPAVIFVLWWIYRPKCIWLAGDIMQNSFCTFVGGLAARYESIVPFCEVALLQEGHRCPFDVYAAGLEVYGKDSGIRPCKCHERPEESLEVHKVSSLQQVELKGKVLTHLQRTKAEVRRLMVAAGATNDEAKERVNTGVEFQGGTAEHVVIVRDVMPARKGSLFHELRRANVMVSRSTGRTVYSTNSSEKDMIVHLVNESRSESNRRIIRDNMRKGGSSFGLKELYGFLEGTLPATHGALVAGKKLKERFISL